MERIFFLPCNEQIKSLIPKSVSVSKYNCGVSHSKWFFSYTLKSYVILGEKNLKILKVNRRGYIQQTLYPGRDAKNGYFLIPGF